MKRLENKVTLITGGSSGIGFTTAQTFAQEGAEVIITGRNQEALNKTVAELGSQVTAIQSDTGKLDDIKRLADELQSKGKRVDVLFLNAGVAKFAPLEQVDEAFYDEMFDINVKGLYFTVKHLLPLMGEGTSIIINASINAYLGMPASSIYAATKAAVISMARTLSGELVERGIRVNAISPGPIETPIFGKMGMSEEQQQEMAAGIQQQVPMGRFGRPEEIAKAALFLASDDSSFVIGAELVADGGMSTL
jgi:NAD(P)-dependent dehydrogenase (short-subunit alcohol dehydrogenase family)